MEILIAIEIATLLWVVLAQAGSTFPFRWGSKCGPAPVARDRPL